MISKPLDRSSILGILLFAGLLALGCEVGPDVGEPGEAGEPEGGVEAPTARSEQPESEEALDAGPIEAQTWLDDFTIGRVVEPDGSIAIGNQGDEFTPGESVYVSMEVADAPDGATVRVDFVKEGDDDLPVLSSESMVPLDARYLSFEADTSGWAVGEYRAEVWIGDERVNDQHFEIVEGAESA